MSDFSLRPAAREEAPELAEILVAACRAGYTEFAPAPVLDSLDATAFAHQITAGWDTFQTLLAVDATDAPLGFVRFGTDHSGDSNGGVLWGHVQSLYVSPQAWDRGVGGALLGAALDLLDADGLDTVTLWVFEGNHVARRFYERHGFTATATTRLAEWGLPAIRYVHAPVPRPAQLDDVPLATSPTEDRNPGTADIDQLTVRRLLERGRGAGLTARAVSRQPRATTRPVAPVCRETARHTGSA